MDSLEISGKTYISSKRAAQACGYAQDYIGQLARKGLIDAQRIGGLWYVLMESVEAYKKQAEAYKPEPYKYQTAPAIESEITIEGKKYISSQLASEITGYNSDYVAQLAREAKVMSQQVGNRWYVDKDALISHKEEKDGLLAAVQAESVGLLRPQSKIQAPVADSSLGLLKYTVDSKDLYPVFKEKYLTEDPLTAASETEVRNEPARSIPINVLQIPKNYTQYAEKVHIPKQNTRVSIPRKTIFKGTFSPSVFALALVLVFGIIGGFTVLPMLKKTNQSSDSLTASAAASIESVAAQLEPILAKELTFKRQ